MKDVKDTDLADHGGKFKFYFFGRNNLIRDQCLITQGLRKSSQAIYLILNAMGLSLTILAIFLLVPSYSLLYSVEFPNNETFSKWNRMLELKLSDLADSVTQANFAKSVYKFDPAVTLERVNGEEFLKSVLEKTRHFLQEKKSALKNLVDNAEEKFQKFQNSNRSMLTLKDLSFFNMKALKPEDQLSFDYRFRQKVNFQKSGTHIPLEIFDGYIEILNGLNWTASLDEVFKKNWKKDPTLRWQYFGSYYGFMKVYPAFRWPDHPSLPDLFDVRRRSWYIQGSVTPKDVIILIDRSGSVHGPTLDIMKITARALLNSLGENDYVNVAWFNNKVKWVVPCLKTLVQATAQMKRLLGVAVDRLTESNRTSYATALDFAFEAFKEFDETKKPWAGSNCHKIIMFLSDGGTEWPSELVTKHCNESRNGRIKIFTFACGPHPIPTVVLKEMACATGGYFSPVTALGSVRVKIQDYVKVLSRGLAYSQDTDLYHWHPVYRDVGGLGMVTAVTLPVFNRSFKNNSFAHLLGVMGTDIPVKEMAEFFPKRLLGPFGYSFAINTNGFVLFHPRLHDHIVYIEDPPSIYLTDLEGETEKVRQMEKEMIDGSHGFLKSYQSIVPVGLGHAILVDMDYFYGSAEPSTFRFGLAIPSNQTVIKVRIPDKETLAYRLSEIPEIVLAPWDFCQTDLITEELTVEKLSQRILHNYTSCNEDLINHLLWDLEKVSLIKSHWDQINFPLIRSRFIITTGGLTVHSSKAEHKYNRQTDPYKNNLFKRATTASGFVFSIEKKSWKTATVARKITYAGSTTVAVIGAEFDQEMIQRIFDEVTMSGNKSCLFSEFFYCYLLNDGGIIVASNREAYQGDFIGLHDPELLEALISVNIYKREYRYNYQSWCSKNNQYVQATATTYHWSILKFLYEILISFQWNFFYTTLLYFISSVSAWKKVESADTLDSGNHSCVTKSAWYYHSGLLTHSGTINCETNSRNFQAVLLPNVTLTFLIAQPHCKDPQSYIPIPLTSEEDTEPKHCTDGQHYRLRPQKCYLRTPKDIFSDCGASSTGHATVLDTSMLVTDIYFIFFVVTTVISYEFFIVYI